MRNDGEKLRNAIKTSGYDIVGIAKLLNVSSQAVQKDLHRKELTRRTLVKYVPALFQNVDDFFIESTKNDKDVVSPSGTVPIEMYAELQAKYIALSEKAGAEKDRYIGLLEQHLELTRRFFPNAVQRVIASL